MRAKPSKIKARYSRPTCKNCSYESAKQIIIIHAFITSAHLVVVLNQRRWWAGQHGEGVDELVEKVSFQTAFEGVKSG